MARSTKKVTPSPKKMGRPKGSLSQQLPDWKQEYMYQVWNEKQSDAHVSRECEVHHQTVRRYRERNDWRGRRALEAQARVAGTLQPIDSETSELEAATDQAISRLTIILGKTLDALMDLKFTKAEHAWKAYKEAQELLLELKGRTTGTQVNLILVAAERFQKDPKDVTASVEVTAVQEDADQ